VGDRHARIGDLLARDWEGFAEWPDWERYLLDAMSLLGAIDQR
jgi:hypothetical protein